MAIGKPYKYWVQIWDDVGDFYKADAGVWVGVWDATCGDPNQDVSCTHKTIASCGHSGWVVDGCPTPGRKMSIANGQCTCAQTWQGKCTVAQCTSTFSDTPTAAWPGQVKIVGYAWTG